MSETRAAHDVELKKVRLREPVCGLHEMSMRGRLSEEPNRMYDPLGEPYNGHAEHDAADALYEPRAFWGFTLSGGANLGEVARFYGLSVPGLEPRTTLADYLSRNGEGGLYPGYRATVGGAGFLVLETWGGVARKVGLELPPRTARRVLRRGKKQAVA